MRRSAMLGKEMRRNGTSGTMPPIKHLDTKPVLPTADLFDASETSPRVLCKSCRLPDVCCKKRTDRELVK